jgi:thiamine biosynthesis lipoprotein
MGRSRRILIAVSSIVVVVVALIVTVRLVGAAPPVTDTYFLMDTVLTVKTSGGDAGAINSRLHELAQAVESLTSYYQEDSDTMRVNNGAGSGPVQVSAEYAALLRTVLDVSQLSSGKVDIAISPVSSLWGFTTKQFRVPSADEIQLALSYSQHTQVRLSGQAVSLQDRRARIDLSGIAKGYSLDVMQKYLRTVSPQPRQVIVDFGGNLLLYSAGRKTDWKVGIRDPRGSGIIGYVRSGDAFVATSGDYERYFEQGGKRYCHIIDPATGFPSTANRSITVITQTGDLAGSVGDALGKAFFCSTADEQQSLFDLVDDRVLGIVVIAADGTERTLGPISLTRTAGM